MEKIRFRSEEIQGDADFFVLEQTKVNGVSYILVTDSEEEDAECLILKDKSERGHPTVSMRSWRMMWSLRRYRKCLKNCLKILRLKGNILCPSVKRILRKC